MRNLIAFSLAAVLAAGGVLLGCQGYQFEEVTPKAIAADKQPEPIVGIQKPAKIMLVLDKSGSMKTFASSDTQWGCAADGNGNGYNPAGDCKWITLVDLLTKSNGFLEQTAGSARHGLAMFSDPNNTADSCAAGNVEVAVPDNAGASVGTIKSKLLGYTPQGGTPTAPTMRNIASDTPFTKKEAATKSYVVLITDGNPNCNSSLSQCNACTNGGDPAKMCGDVRNCLDDVALTSAVKMLKAKDIDTFVIGFGSAFSNPDAKKALNDAAVAGGQVSSDPNAKFYLATDETSLQAIFDKIKTVLQACTFGLDQVPKDPTLLEVTVYNQKTKETAKLKAPTTPQATDGDWNYTDGTYTTVAIGSQWCKTLQEAEADTFIVYFTSVKEL